MTKTAKPISGFDPPVDPAAAIREFDGTVIRIPNPSRLAIILEPGSVETGSRTVVQDCNFGLVLTIAPEAWHYKHTLMFLLPTHCPEDVVKRTRESCAGGGFKEL